MNYLPWSTGWEEEELATIQHKEKLKFVQTVGSPKEKVCQSEKNWNTRHKGTLHSFASSFSMALYLECMRKTRHSIGDKRTLFGDIGRTKWLLAVGVGHKAVPWTYLSLKAKISAAAGKDLKLATSGNEKECHWHKHRRKKNLYPGRWAGNYFRIKSVYIYQA